MLSEFLRKNPKKGEQEIIIDEFKLKGFKRTSPNIIKQCFWEIFNKRIDPSKKRKPWGSISQLNDSLQAGINRCAQLGIFNNVDVQIDKSLAGNISLSILGDENKKSTNFSVGTNFSASGQGAIAVAGAWSNTFGAGEKIGFNAELNGKEITKDLKFSTSWTLPFFWSLRFPSVFSMFSEKLPNNNLSLQAVIYDSSPLALHYRQIQHGFAVSSQLGENHKFYSKFFLRSNNMPPFSQKSIFGQNSAQQFVKEDKKFEKKGDRPEKEERNEGPKGQPRSMLNDSNYLEKNTLKHIEEVFSSQKEEEIQEKELKNVEDMKKEQKIDEKQERNPVYDKQMKMVAYINKIFGNVLKSYPIKSEIDSVGYEYSIDRRRLEPISKTTFSSGYMFTMTNELAGIFGVENVIASSAAYLSNRSPETLNFKIPKISTFSFKNPLKSFNSALSDFSGARFFKNEIRAEVFAPILPRGLLIGKLGANFGCIAPFENKKDKNAFHNDCIPYNDRFFETGRGFGGILGPKKTANWEPLGGNFKASFGASLIAPLKNYIPSPSRSYMDSFSKANDVSEKGSTSEKMTSASTDVTSPITSGSAPRFFSAQTLSDVGNWCLKNTHGILGAIPFNAHAFLNLSQVSEIDNFMDITQKSTLRINEKGSELKGIVGAGLFFKVGPNQRFEINYCKPLKTPWEGDKETENRWMQENDFKPFQMNFVFEG